MSRTSSRSRENRTSPPQAAPGSYSATLEDRASGRITTGHLIALLVLFVGSIFLRSASLGTYPAPRSTNDEYHYLWVGLSLLDTGAPVSWSYQSVPQTRIAEVEWAPHPLVIVRPALDHPPLYSLLAGVVAKMTGAKPVNVPAKDGGTVQLYDVDMGGTRVLSILLYAVSFLLLFDLIRRAVDTNTALLTVGFFGIISHIVLHQRLLVTESLSTPIWLLSLWSVQRYVTGTASRRSMAITTAVCCALAVLCKLVTASQGAAVAFMLLMYGRRKETIYPAIGVAAGILVYVVYCALQSWPAFVGIMRAQSGRFDDFSALTKAFVASQLVHMQDVNSMLFAGWVCTLAALLSPNPVRLLGVFGTYLGCFAFFASSSGIYGWHWMPVYPFLCLGLALVTLRVFTTAELFPSLLFLLLFVPFAGDVLISHMKPLTSLVRYGYLGVLGGMLWMLATRPPSLIMAMRGVVTVVFLIIGVSEIQHAFPPPPPPVANRAPAPVQPSATQKPPARRG
jgi:hypothetical protein